ncbi:endonuclease domain-containing protein [Leifsonia sp. 2TAF2]|uniref:endonuclease domain-containing protein n=1 Tax=Leifsonia sp. 2TAF2 TaxID=3233009 RepID=UPI003F9664E8
MHGYRTVMREGTFFSHSTAAALYGLPLPRWVLHHTLHVSSVLPSRAPKGRGVIGHALGRAPRLRAITGFTVPEPVEVWCQLAAQLTVDDLVLAGDALLRRKHPLCDHQELTDAARTATARPGVRKLRAAAELVRARTDSPMESVLRLAIVRAGLPEPEVNFTIIDATGRAIASGDLVYPSVRLVIEYDGDHHRSNPVQYQADIDRLYRIETLGWAVLRISKEHMRHDACEAVRRIRGALKTGGPNTPRSHGR